MNKDEALKFIQEERVKELTEVAEKLNALIKDYDVTLDAEVIVNPSGVFKKVIVVDNKKIL